MTSRTPPRRYGDLALYRRLFRQARPYWRHLGTLFSLSLVGAPLALLLPLPVKIVVDGVLDERPLWPWLARILPAAWQATPQSLLLASTGALVVIALLINVQAFITWVYKTWIGERLLLAFRARLFDHLQRLSLAFHTKEGTMDSIYRLQIDAAAIRSVSIYGVIPFVTSLLTVVVLVYVTARIDLTLALVAIGAGPVVFGLTELYRGRLRRRWAAARETESSAMSVVQESLSAVRVVKAFGQEDRESERYRRHASEGLRASVAAVRAHGTFDLLVGLATGVGAAVILYLGARHVQDGVITLGELLLVIAYLSQLFTPLRELGTRLADVQSALASAARVYAVLDQMPEIAEAPGAQPLDRAEGAFAFQGVTFAYGDHDPVLRDVHLDIPAGSRVGIAGRTGSGKSTLLSLLPRFYDPDSGVVLLDGTDLKALKLKDLRRQFAVVLQESVLFSTSVRENIAYGRPDATAEAIQQAARDAAAHDFIEALPEGYETNVGERGTRLSGGERQRVALARAFLQDAPILILDEPTSALDTGTEMQVMEALERLMRGRTTFIIAHRLSTLEGCDIRIEVRDQQAIVHGADLSGVGID